MTHEKYLCPISFREKEPFDWYQRYSGIQHLMTSKILSPQASFPQRESIRVLVPGCGNSLLMEHMLDDGYKDITNVDFSPVVISQMEERYKDRGMVFKVADVTRSLPFPDASFDLVVCKGTLDAVLCGNGASVSARNFMDECSRVLDADHGVLVIVSYGTKENRIMYLEDEKVWPGGVEIFEVPKPRVNSPNVEDKGSPNHFIYICRKKGRDNLEEQMETLKLEEEKKSDCEDTTNVMDKADSADVEVSK